MSRLFLFLFLLSSQVLSARQIVAELRVLDTGPAVSNMQFPIQTDWKLTQACKVQSVSGVPVVSAACFQGCIGFSFAGFDSQNDYALEFEVIRKGPSGMVLLTYQNQIPGFDRYFRPFSTASANGQLTTLVVGLQGLDLSLDSEILVYLDHPVWVRDWEDRARSSLLYEMPVETSLMESVESDPRFAHQPGLYLHALRVIKVDGLERAEVISRMQEQLTLWFDRAEVRPWLYALVLTAALGFGIWARVSLSVRLSLCLCPMVLSFWVMRFEETPSQRAHRLLESKHRELGELVDKVLDEETPQFRNFSRQFLIGLNEQLQEIVTDESLIELRSVMQHYQSRYDEANGNLAILSKILRDGAMAGHESTVRIFEDYPGIHEKLVRKKPFPPGWRLLDEVHLEHHRYDFLGLPIAATTIGRNLWRLRLLQGTAVTVSDGTVSTDGFKAHFGLRNQLPILSVLQQRLARELTFQRDSSPEDMKQGDVNLEFRDMAKNSGFGTEFIHHYLDQRRTLLPFSHNEFGHNLTRFTWDAFKTKSNQLVTLQIRVEKGQLIRWFLQFIQARMSNEQYWLLAGEHLSPEVPHLTAPAMRSAQLAHPFLSRHSRPQSIFIRDESGDTLFFGGRFLSIGGFTLVLGLPLNQVCAAENQKRMAMVLSLVFGLLFAVFAVYKVVARVLSPLKQMELGLNNVLSQSGPVELQVTSEDELSWLARSFLQMIQRLAEKEAIVGFLAQRAQQDIAANRPTIRTRLSIFFVGVTDPMEVQNLGFEQQIHALDLILNRLQKHLTEQGLWIDKFTGSSILAVLPWDRPIPDFQKRLNSVLRCMEELEAELLESGAAVAISLGIATGFAVCGHIGADRRKDYTVVGDVVNLASRCRDYASKKKRSALACIDEVTALDLGIQSHSFLGYEESIYVRGRQEAVKVYLLTANDLDSN